MTDADRAALKALVDLSQRLQRKVHDDAIYAGAVAAMFSKAAWEHNAGVDWPHEPDDDSYQAFENCIHPDCVLARSAAFSALIAAGLSQPKCQRYDLVQVNACYTTDHEMERSDDGEWVRFEDVQSAGLSEAPAPQEKK